VKAKTTLYETLLKDVIWENYAHFHHEDCGIIVILLWTWASFRCSYML